MDSHLQTPTLTHDRQRFENTEFPPFINAIAAGVDVVMTAHLFVPELDPENIATLSPRILTDILRHEMGFEGLITTDALIMSGIANLATPEAIAVQAVKAGADILLMPVDPIATIKALCAAVESGEISRDRLVASVRRIWQAKQKVCGIPADLSKLGNPKNLQTAKEIASKAISVYSSIEHLQSPNQVNPAISNLSLRAKSYLNLIIVDDPLTCGDFLNARSPAVLLPKQQNYQRIIADSLTLETLQCDRFSDIFMQIFSRGNPFRGQTNMHEKIHNFIHDLLKDKKLEAVVVYGSPYPLDRLLPSLPNTMPWGFAYSQQPEAQEAVLQRLGFGLIQNYPSH